VVTRVPAPRTRRGAVERIAELSLRAAAPAAVDGSFRALMRNGDSLLVASVAGPFRLRVAERLTDVEPRRLERVEFADGGERATAVLLNGDSLSGEIAGGRVELTLAAGPRLSVHPS